MALETFGIQKGFKIFGNQGSAKLFYEDFSGSAPGNGVGSDFDVAVDSSTGHFYRKNSGTWAKYGISADIQNVGAGFRLVEGFQYITAIDVSGFTGLTQTGNLDNGQTVVFTAGDRVASTFNGVVYVAAAGAWTVYGTQPSNNDAFFVTTALMDGALSQGSTFYKFTTGPNTFTRLADFDFEVATTIGFSGYSKPASNAVTAIAGATDTVQAAIEKLDTGADNIRSTIGMGALTDTGVLVTGLIGVSTDSVKNILQAIIDSAVTELHANSITASTNLDQAAISNGKRIEWFLDINSIATPANRYSAKLLAVVDAAGDVSWQFSDIVEKRSAITGLSITLSGSVTDVTLIIASTDAVTVKARRTQI